MSLRLLLGAAKVSRLNSAKLCPPAAGKGFNIPGYKDPKLDDLLTKVQTDTDLTKRKQDVADLQTFMADNLPYIFLWYPQEIDVINSNLQGVPDLNLRDNMHYVAEWWLKK